MSAPPRNTLFVAGFPPAMRARDLGYEFERCGKIVRCDIPALRSPASTPYAFIEFEDARDAEEAHQKMHGIRFGSYTVTVQFAKKAPTPSWKGKDPPRGGRDRRDDRRDSRRGDRRDDDRRDDRRDDRGGRDRRDDRDDRNRDRERDGDRERERSTRDSRDDRDRDHKSERRRSQSPAAARNGDDRRRDDP